MKPQVAPFETRAICLRIECTNGLIVRMTRYPRDLVMSNATVYTTGSGYDFTGYSATTSMSPSSIDMEGFLGFAGVTADAIASGVFDNARCYLFACNYLSPVEDYEPMVCSILGKTITEDSKYRIEEMALIDALNQSVGKTYLAQCPKVFGGQEYAGCKKALGPLTVTGTLTGVSSASAFTDTARAEAADYFAMGTIRFTSGANAGLKPLEIKSFTAGVIQTFEPFYFPPAIGDAYSMIPGCRKRRDEDCRDKWNNILNFGGFKDMPTSSVYSHIGGNDPESGSSDGGGGLSEGQQHSSGGVLL